MSVSHSTPNISSSAVSIIAEAGVNHNGDLALARELVHAAAEAGADAVKFQSFKAEQLVTSKAAAAAYQQRNTGKASQIDLLRALELDIEAFGELAALAQKLGIEFMSTPFDISVLPDLLRLGMRRIKIASGELTNEPALRIAASYKLPLLISTGMATLQEVRRALDVVSETGPADVTVLHCTSLYPAPAEYLNLRAITTLREAFQIPVGFSDHSLGIEAAVAAVVLGATVIEKHLTLDRKLDGPDHVASLTPGTFADMVKALRNIRNALGDGVKRPSPKELETAALVRRSWHAKRALNAGHQIQSDDIFLTRPASGLAPSDCPVGRVLAVAVGLSEPIRARDLA